MSVSTVRSRLAVEVARQAIILMGMAAFAAPQASWANSSTEAADEASAADAGGGGEGIVVTARRREENLQDVPMSISALGEATIETQRLNQFQDFATRIPNFNPSTGNPRTSSLSIRGVGGLGGGGDGSESGVGVIVDDVFYTYVGYAWGPLYDVAAVEVARGPQGTLLGKNTTVGAVIVRNNAPSFTPSARLEVGVGNFGSTLIKAHGTGPLIDDNLAFRVSYYREKNDGLFANNWPPVNDSQRANQRLKDTNRWAIRGQLLFEPTENISSRLIVDHINTREFNNYSGTVAPVFTHFANGTPYRSYEQKIAQLYGITDIDHDPYTGEETNPSPWGQTVTGISNQLNVDFGGVSLTSVTAWRQIALRPRNTQGKHGLLNYSLGYDNDQHFFSQEFRLASEPSDRFDWQVGAYGLIDNRVSNNRVILGRTAASFYGTVLPPSFTAPVPITINPDVLDGLEYDRYGVAKTRSIAAFGQGTLHIARGLDLTAGIRYTYEQRKGSNTGYSFNGVPDSQLIPSDLALREDLLRRQFGGYFSVSGKDSSGAISWLVNPSYKITDEVMVYASAARGVKSGAVNTDARPIYSGSTVVGSMPVITEPERSLDFELGIKSAWLNNRLTINVNLYQNDIRDYQDRITDTSTYVDVNGQVVTATFLGNIEHVRLRGVEVETSFRLEPGIDFYLAGAITSAKYIEYANAGSPADFQYRGGPETVDNSGQKVPGIPPWTVSIGVNFDRPIGQIYDHDVALFGFINQFLTGKTRFTDPLSTYYLGQPTYGLTNASIGVRSLDERLSLSVWAKNLFDQNFTTNKTLGTTNAPPTWTLGEPRTYGVTAVVNF